ncbi:YbhB/YbcL family Raf kinase inhibitor-like protein [Halopseudomonas nanhaiensis]|uniref:YbhB/YbcL family Raf kinase inhibitor-like protein n=1 Tax=Halopseudomonas nanhaiensis TaxID=2830842 RepID=UPI001CC0EAC7|nr:YbhB/YbcL family Raf kinase inhibitor-like protein [Halopseudomonas nanhaiensis]UAW99825.1 YbhB/YbcL family Raf kinase inhibitor-like protein [Halopseudomonas nanhaiensis]
MITARPFYALPLIISGAAVAQDPVQEQTDDLKASEVEIVGHVLQPAETSVSPDQLAVPAGFEVNVFAEDLVNPRMIAVSDDGTVYVTRQKTGDVMMLRDTDGDGTADERRIVANRPNMHGIAIDGNTVYLVTIKNLYRTRILEDGSFEPLERLLDDLPDAGQHPNRTVVIGPDKALYLSVGSTCNSCNEANPENATMLQVKPDGSSRKVFASGLRNTIGFGFEPETGRLYGLDHGTDWLGDNVQHEELNLIREGSRYGWPYVYDDGKPNPADAPPGGISHEQWAQRSVNPVGLYVPHAAPMQMAFYTGQQFPDDYRGDAFVAMRGSWNRKPPSGYEVVRIHFESGRPIAFEPFVTGFLTQDGDQWTRSARLAGLAQAGDGSLLVSDDSGGIIYRVSYSADAAQSAEPVQMTPTNPEGAWVGMLDDQQVNRQERPPASSKLATDLLQHDGPGLQISSAAFEPETSIPAEHVAEEDDISPALSWQAGPEGTQSYVVIMEDPDASTASPFVHWLLYDVPADVTELSPGIPGMPRLTQLDGAYQGQNDRGTLGYYGPRPPKGENPHRYHFHVFALNSKLGLPFGVGRTPLLEAMRDKVLASGTLVGTYQRQ